MLSCFERLLYLEHKTSIGHQSEQFIKYPLLQNISSDKGFQEFKNRNRVVFESLNSDGSQSGNSSSTNFKKTSGQQQVDNAKNLARSFVNFSEYSEKEKNILMQSLQFFRPSDEQHLSNERRSKNNSSENALQFVDPGLREQNYSEIRKSSAISKEIYLNNPSLINNNNNNNAGNNDKNLSAINSKSNSMKLSLPKIEENHQFLSVQVDKQSSEMIKSQTHNAGKKKACLS